MIRASGIPYTLVHATQFFEFAGGILQMSLAEDQVRLPDANIQPIASQDVATFMAQVALASPANKILEIGGPEKFPMAAWIGQYAKATGKGQEIVTDAKALYSGAAIEANTLAPQAAVYLGSTKYADWIAQPHNQR